MTTPERPHREAFADRVSRLSAPEFEQFVVDLYVAQGWSVSRDGAALHLHRETPIPATRSVLAVAESEDPIPASVTDVDVVVSSGRSAVTEQFAEDRGARFRGPDDLYELAMFGVDRETTTSLLRDHLEWDVDLERRASGANPSPSAGPERTTTDARRRRTDPASGPPEPRSDDHRLADLPRLDRSAATAAVALLVVVALLVGLGGGLDATSVLGDGRSPGGSSDAASTGLGGSATDVGATTAESNVSGSAFVVDDPGAGATDPAIRSRYVGLSPTCERAPELVAVIIVEALRHNDPETDDGVRTAWNFSSRSSRGSTYRTFSRFVGDERFDPLYESRRATYTSLHREPGISTHRVTVTDSDGVEHTYDVVLAKQTGGSEDGCWLLAGIVAGGLDR